MKESNLGKLFKGKKEMRETENTVYTQVLLKWHINGFVL